LEAGLKISYSKGYRVFSFINYTMLIVTGLICLAPFITLLAVSFSDRAAVSAGKVFFWPVGFTLSSYEFALQGGKFLRAFIVSVERVLLGVGVNLILMICAAYPLSKPKERLAGWNVIMAYFIITMIISGGLIPTYLVVVGLGLLNSMWALVLPGALPIWTMVILMNFIRQLPQDIEDAAMIDGAGIFLRLVKVMLPLLKPALATVGLFCIVGHWNDWFSGMIYMQDPSRYPLQTYLQNLMMSVEEIMHRTGGSGGSNYQQLLSMINGRTGRAASLFLGTIPMMAIYPFLQKYFTTGLVIGSIKG
jgi:putative aldouronate transport system permease protein